MRYLSRIGSVLRARHMTVGELQRRLEARQVRVSHGALHRIVSDRPIETVSLPVVLPVLEELDLPFEDAFEPISEADAAERARARQRAKEILAGLPRRNRGDGQAGSPEVEAERDEMITRGQELLREKHPELFDERGRLRRREAAREIARRLRGQRYASEADYIALTAGPDNHVSC